MNWFFLALTAAILEGLASVVEKKTLNKEHAMQFSAIFAVFTAILTLPFLLRPGASISLIPFLFITGGSILSSIALLLSAKGVRHTEISISSPLFMLSPGITAIFAFAFLGESLKSTQIGGLILLLIGGYFLEMKSGEPIKEHLKKLFDSKYIHYILAALLIFGVSSMFDRLVLGYYHVDPKTYLAIIQICIAINFIIMMEIFHDGIKGIFSGIKSYGLSVLLIALMAVGYRLAQSTATSLAFVGLVVSVKRTSSIFSTVIGGELFKEENLVQKTLACLVMFLGIIVLIK